MSSTPLEDQFKVRPFVLPNPQFRLHRSGKGRPFWLRHLAETDTALLRDFLSSLSAATLWSRYFVAYPALSTEAVGRETERLYKIQPNGVVLVATATLADREEIVGLGEMIPLARETLLPPTAELALTVRDDYQGEAIGTTLAYQLVEEAIRKGISTLQGETLAHNRATLRIWTKLGLPYSFHYSDGITTMLAWPGR